MQETFSALKVKVHLIVKNQYTFVRFKIVNNKVLHVCDMIHNIQSWLKF